MTVLFHELLVPGWADTKIGVYELTRNENSGYKEDEGFGLPCHSVDPELFFSESQEALETAKDLCTACPMRARCLEGAISRQEPWGVWGGEIFDNGVVVQTKRQPGRPRSAA